MTKRRLRQTEINPEPAFDMAERGRMGQTAEGDLETLLGCYQAAIDDLLPGVKDAADAGAFVERMQALISDLRDLPTEAREWAEAQGAAGGVIAGVVADAASYGIALAVLGAEAQARPVAPHVAFSIAERARRKAFGRRRWADDDRQAEHDRWREAAKLVRADAQRTGQTLSKIEVARRVRARLGLKESAETIRKRL